MPVVHDGIYPASTTSHYLWKCFEKQASFDGLLNDLNSESQENSLRATYPPGGRGTCGKSLLAPTSHSTSVHNNHTIHSEINPAKPKVVTVVKAGRQPYKKITILLNRRCMQTFEQLIADISEALGHPCWKSQSVKTLYTLKGKEIRSVSDFFRGDDMFIAAGREKLTMVDVQDVLEELYPDSPCAQSLIQQQWFQSQKPYNKCSDKKGSKADEPELSKPIGSVKSARQIAKNIEKVRATVRKQEREKARKWEQERSEREKRELSEKQKEKERIQKKNPSFNADREIEKCKINKREVKQKQEEMKREIKNDTGTCRSECRRTKDEIKRFWVPELEGEKEKREKGSDQNLLYEVEEKEREYTRKSRGKKLDAERAQPLNNIKEEKKQLKDRSRLVKVESERWQNGKLRYHEQVDNDEEEEIYNHPEGLLNEEDENYKNAKQENQKDERKQYCGQQKLRNKEDQRWKDMGCKEAQSQPPSTFAVEKIIIRKDNDTQSRETHMLTSKPQQTIPQREIESYYEIGSTIGDGNFALVKECRLRNTEEWYAVKIIDKAKIKGKEDMIKNEIAIVKSISHPNIVRFIEEFESDTEIYIIMEYVHGGDLFDAITENVKFTEQCAAFMITNLCKALAYIHSKNIVHRDMKPENLLVQCDADGNTALKLADFGLAVKVTEPIFTVCGTPTYVAPEILSETGYGLEVDMWATGVILYILLCGFPPFRSLERDQEELFEIIQLGEYEFLSPYWDNISDGVKGLISKLLVVDPKKRYTAQHVLQHHWIQLGGKMNTPTLKGEMTTNLEAHFKSHHCQEMRDSAV
ncbi:serine/threonine-protein kinase DCLK3 [Callorhinchus milii]|uniref:serine/threonine-protein kinase DCLK3 n=1 Tax=Callorhinchus milii TaxID=7868 RepID=UPI001C3F90C7|nr:serine/threonine-protein kinase DCLK3 [Callorhinchus milii]